MEPEQLAPESHGHAGSQALCSIDLISASGGEYTRRVPLRGLAKTIDASCAEKTAKSPSYAGPAPYDEMATRITDGWQWPGSYSNDSSLDSDDETDRTVCTAPFRPTEAFQEIGDVVVQYRIG